MSHDAHIFETMENEVKKQYTLKLNNTMSYDEKQELVMSICRSVYEDRKTEFWYSENPVPWIKNCVSDIMYW